jgi:hypothetical protein
VFLLYSSLWIEFIPPSSTLQYRVTAQIALLRLSIFSSIVVSSFNRTDSASFS